LLELEIACAFSEPGKPRCVIKNFGRTRARLPAAPAMPSISMASSSAMMTLFQPPIMADVQFDQAMKEMGIEMAKLKEVLER